MNHPKHLLPETARLLLTDPETRCELIKKQRFVPYPAGMKALHWLRYLYRMEYGRDRPRSLHLLGSAGMGKSRILAQHANLYGSSDRDAAGHRACPVVLVEMPADGDYRKLCTRLLSACIPEFHPQKPANYLDRVGRIIRECGVRQILIDEAGHLLNAGKITQQQSLALLKSITNQGITICIATTENMKAVLAADEQLYSRFRQVRLPPWRESQALREFLMGIEAQLPLPEPSRLDRMQVIRWLLSNGYMVTSPMLELLRDAASLAIRSEQTHISLDLLKQAATAELPPDPKLV